MKQPWLPAVSTVGHRRKIKHVHEHPTNLHTRLQIICPRLFVFSHVLTSALSDSMLFPTALFLTIVHLGQWKTIISWRKTHRNDTLTTILPKFMVHKCGSPTRMIWSTHLLLGIAKFVTGIFSSRLAACSFASVFLFEFSWDFVGGFDAGCWPVKNCHGTNLWPSAWSAHRLPRFSCGIWMLVQCHHCSQCDFVRFGLQVVWIRFCISNSGSPMETEQKRKHLLWKIHRSPIFFYK